jgi:hypothetical protein
LQIALPSQCQLPKFAFAESRWVSWLNHFFFYFLLSLVCHLTLDI